MTAWRPAGGSNATVLDLRTLRLSDVRFSRSLYLPMHEHERDTIAVLLAGEIESITSKAEASKAGTAIVEPAGDRHACRFGPQGARMLVLQPDWRDGALSCTKPLFRQRTSVRDGRVAASAWTIVRELERPDQSTPLVVEGLAMEIFGVGSRKASQRDGSGARPCWLLRAEESLRAGFRAPRPLREVAKDAGVHPVHLQRVFRKSHGMSMGAFQRRLRLEWAAQRLASSSEPIVEIALDAGFFDHSHFTRVFGREYGCPPAQYRREQQR